MARKRLRLTRGEGWALADACPRCGEEESKCRCEAPRGPRGTPVFRLRLERRRGKAVTICAADGLPEADLRELARGLKALCGSGGTVAGNEIELQGDQRERARSWLAERDHRVKG